MSSVLTAFVVYLVAILVIGVFTARRVSSQGDYLLGGQKLPAWAIAISERASGESAWLLLGLSGAALSVGLSEIWTVVGCVSGILFLWFFIGAKLRAALDRTDALTVPELLAQRVEGGDAVWLGATHRQWIRFVAACIIVFFFTFYVAAQMAGAGKIFVNTGVVSETFAWLGMGAEGWGVLLGAGVVILYTLLGGFGAVVWTDLLQGVIMIVALLVLPIVALIELKDGGPGLMGALGALGEGHTSFFAGAGGFAAVLVLLNGLSWGLGYMGQPHLLVRFMAMPSADGVRRNRALAAVWTIVAYGGAFAIGLLGLALYGGTHFPDVERVMPTMAMALLPAWVGGIVVAGAVAAMMSTADSQLLVVTSAVSEDIVRRIAGKALSARAQVWLSRAVVLAIGVGALLLALTSTRLVYAMVSFAWSGLGASFGPVILLMLTRQRLHARAVIACMLTGSLVTIVWSRVDLLSALCSERLAAWLLALAAALVVQIRQIRQVRSK